MRRVLAALVVAACGGGGTPAAPDAGLTDAPVDDTPTFAACREFAGAAISVPAHVVGTLSAADVESPQCATVDAQFGTLSAGPDSVIAIDGLVPGTAYFVQLRSLTDLAFYVASGCSTENGPAASECALFVDANATGGELGRFVATATRAFVIVDYYASATPTSLAFTLDVFAEACTEDSTCTTGLPVCSDGRCVQCGDDFDCKDAAMPRCDRTATTCVGGVDACSVEDVNEPEDDGPAGAFVFVPNGSGSTSTTSQICGSPRSELDYYAFEVTAVGEIWDVTLSWTGTRDLDMEVYSASGVRLGMSLWEQPETLRLTYLPIGTYYIKVKDFGTSVLSVDYTLGVQRTQGTGCTVRADCATEYRNQLFRGDCQAGACVALTGNGMVAQGGFCDSVSDCATGLSCPSFYFVANADTRDVCAPTCTDTTDCAGLGADYVCTTYLIQNLCVQKCTADEQCPIDVNSEPVSGPWYRLRCQQSTGRCLP